MRVARYVGEGQVAIHEEAVPTLPEGGLLVRTEACGLCSGELMDWYMDRKIPHVLGHEVAGKVVASDTAVFPVGARVFPHHHAPCLLCELCRSGRHVHCLQWKRTRLVPGGMAEFFAVPAENLHDTLVVDDLRAVDAALIEPLACVMKSLKQSAIRPQNIDDHSANGRKTAVVGLGVMGLMHMLMLRGATGFDINPDRVEWAANLGLDASCPEICDSFSTIFVCPGSQAAFDFALSIAEPCATIVMFAPLPPGEDLRVPQEAYFRDIRIAHAYSCGPVETLAAADAIRRGQIRSEQVVSDFIGMDELPQAYQAMKTGRILKPMVVFD